MYEISKLDFSTKICQAPPYGLGSNSNRSSRSKNIEIPTGYSMGAHIHVAPDITPPPHHRPLPLRLRISWRTWRAFHWCLDRLRVMPSGDGVPNCARQHDLSRCLSVFDRRYLHAYWIYLTDMLDDIPEDIRGESATPAAHYPFDISEDVTKLSQPDANLFRNFVAQLLYLSKWERPDIQLEVSFLCPRVIEPDVDGYKKLARVKKYTQFTIGLLLILSIKNYGNIKWYVDAEFAVHKDMRSCTGGFVTMGTGGAYVQSSKKNWTLRVQLRLILSE